MARAGARTMNIPELVSPAGNLAKGLAALRFGADAVYCGLERFSLRRKAGNFTPDELGRLIEAAHGAGKRVYLAVNIFPRDADLAGMGETMACAAKLGADALIVSDPAALRLAQRHAPGVPLHLSTQANTLNAVSAAFWFDSGVARIILARELSLDAVRGIVKAHPGRPFEVFAHGALCMAYSGRCFISHYLVDRDSNRGDCAHACRWSYKVEEALRPGEVFPVEEGPDGTLIYFSRDLCALPFLPRLADTGVSALKIEGRIKSLYYVAVVTSVYRRALEALRAGPDVFAERLPAMQAELDRLPNRGYTSHFYLGKPGDDAPGQPPDAREEREDYLGLIGGTIDGWTALDVKNTFGVADPLEVLKPGGGVPARLDALRDRDGNPAERVHSGARAGVRLDVIADPGDILRRRPGPS
ncbi:MAG: U32 family peptidase C-terminal domain-containing protein [Acidobacteria bacterium]|nr:U32 family peptidase C-terminal domain-containing protein [Acidobacteriota bacterium]